MRILCLLALALSLAAADDVRADNIKDWATSSSGAASSTRTASTVTIYLKRNDLTNYYIITERREDAEAVKMDIDGIDYGLAQTGLRVVKSKAKKFNTSPRFTLSKP